jgi:hypothetical protein
VRTTASWLRRVWRAWFALDRERRLASTASLALFVALFLPWYSARVVATGGSARGAARLLPAASVTAWGAFSWAEGMVLLVALAVLVLLFRRAEGRTFPPAGLDGWTVALAGGWACLVIVWRMFDKPGLSGHGQLVLSTGLGWGIFVALLVAAWLAWTGARIRAAHAPAATNVDAGAKRGGARRERRPRQRSSWSPAERPAWTGPDASPAPVRAWPDFDEPREKPVGWLTAPPKHGAAPPRPVPAERRTDPTAGDQLTIPLDSDR